jgi:hypothetical protein
VLTRAYIVGVVRRHSRPLLFEACPYGELERRNQRGRKPRSELHYRLSPPSGRSRSGGVSVWLRKARARLRDTMEYPYSTRNSIGILRAVEYLIILPKDIFARPQSPGARQPVLALSEGFDLFSLHGSSFSVLAACQLWPLTRLLSIV